MYSRPSTSRRTLPLAVSNTAQDAAVAAHLGLAAFEGGGATGLGGDRHQTLLAVVVRAHFRGCVRRSFKPQRGPARASTAYGAYQPPRKRPEPSLPRRLGMSGTRDARIVVVAGGSCWVPPDGSATATRRVVHPVPHRAAAPRDRRLQRTSGLGSPPRDGEDQRAAGHDDIETDRVLVQQPSMCRFIRGCPPPTARSAASRSPVHRGAGAVARSDEPGSPTAVLSRRTHRRPCETRSTTHSCSGI